MKPIETMMLDKFRAAKQILELKEADWKKYYKAKYGREPEPSLHYLCKSIEALAVLEHAIEFAENLMQISDVMEAQGYER